LEQMLLLLQLTLLGECMAAESSSSQEKTEEPTEEKLRKAREKGQVAKSQDFVSAGVLLGSSAVIFALLLQNGVKLSAYAKSCFLRISNPNSAGFEIEILQELLSATRLAAELSLPLVLGALLFAVIFNYVEVGFIFSTEPLKPDMDKISPIKGMKQIFSAKRLLEVVKYILKFFGIGSVVIYALHSHLRDVVLSEQATLRQSMGLSYSIIVTIFKYVVLLFMGIGIVDRMLQRRLFKKNMMMTKQEIKQEFKEMEGQPEVKHEQKRRMRENAMEEGPAAVKKAQVVVTNPAHVAVALAYNENMAAPIVVAKGVGDFAHAMRLEAKRHCVPVVRDVPLAHALHRLDVDVAIPEKLYDAVAELLHFVYELKNSGATQ
jgi:flagellar biosynthetic protein FlhB